MAAGTRGTSEFWGGGGVPTMAVQAVFIDKASAQIEKFNRRVAAAEGAMQAYAQRTTESSQKAAAAVEKGAKAQTRSQSTISRGLRSLRWEIVSILYFFRIMGRVMTAVAKEVAEAMEMAGARRGIQALAAVYSVNARLIAFEMRKTANATITATEAMKLAQAGLLQDQGRFASEYVKLWEAARVAAVTTGVDATKAFQAMVGALADGDAQVLDSVVGIFDLEDALIRYAQASGRVVDQLTEQEKAQVMLERIYTRTGKLIEAGADDALEQTKALDQLKTAWKEFVQVLVAAATPALGFLKKVVIAATQSIALIGGAIAFYAEMIKYAWELQSALALATLDLPRAAELIGEFDETYLKARTAALEEFARVVEPLGLLFGEAAEGVDTFTESLSQSEREAHNFQSRMRDLEIKYLARLEDLYVDYWQRLEDVARRGQQRLEEIEIKGHRKREDLWIRLQRKLADAWRDYLRGIERLEQGQSDKRIRIWERYWNKIRQINYRFQDSMYDAIARRDATAALKAIRRRDRDIREAGILRDQELGHIRRNYETQLEELRERLRRQREDAARAYEQGLEDLERNLQQQREDLARALKRQREDLKRHLDWRIQELQNQYTREMWELYSSLTGKENMYLTHYGRVEIMFGNHVANMKQIWSEFVSGLPLPAGTPQEWYGGGGSLEFGQGGMAYVDKRTSVTVGEGGRPEIVMVVPVGGGQVAAPSATSTRHEVSGEVSRNIRVTIDQGVSGFEGRLESAVVAAIMEVMR